MRALLSKQTLLIRTLTIRFEILPTKPEDDDEEDVGSSALAAGRSRDARLGDVSGGLLVDGDCNTKETKTHDGEEEEDNIQKRLTKQ